MDERAPLGLARAAAWIALAVTLPLVIFIIGTDALLAVPEARLSVHVLLVIAGAIWVLVASRGAPFPPLAIWLLPLVAAIALSTLTSVRPAASREALALSLLVLLTYPLMFAVWSDPALRRRLEWLVVVMTSLLIVAYLAITVALWILWWGAAGFAVPPLRPGNLELTLGSPNAVAFYLELLVPLSAGLAWQRWHHRIGPTLLIAGGLATLVVTGSRGGWLGAIAGVGTAFVVVRPWERGTNIVATIRGHRVAALVATLPVLTAALVAAPRLGLDDAGRTELWAAAWAIFEAHPVLGGGPASWSYLRPTAPIADANTAVLNAPHDIVLHIGADMGVIGLLTAALFAFAVVRTMVRAARRTDGSELIVVAGASAGLVAITAHSLVDSQFRVPGFLLLVFMSLTVLDRAGGGAAPLTQSMAGRIGVVAVSGLIVVISLGMAVPIDLALWRARDADQALVRGDPSSALDAYEDAIQLDDQSQYHLGRALALDGLGRRAEATAAFERVADAENLAYERAILAVSMMDAGDAAGARRAALEVIESGAYDPTATINAARVLGMSGDDSEVVGALAKVIRAVPSLAALDAVTGFEPETWQLARDRAIAESEATDPLAAADLAIWAGDLVRARALVEGAPETPERTVLSAYLGALSGGTVDIAPARTAVRKVVGSARALDWYVRLARLTGSSADERDGRIMLAVGLNGGPSSAWTVRTVKPSDSSTALLVPHYPAAMTSRVGPARRLPDGMLTIEPVSEP